MCTRHGNHCLGDGPTKEGLRCLFQLTKHSGGHHLRLDELRASIRGLDAIRAVLVLVCDHLLGLGLGLRRHTLVQRRATYLKGPVLLVTLQLLVVLRVPEAS